MNECLQILDLPKKIVKLKNKGLTAERVAFSFMKHRIQKLMKREHLGYEYTGPDDVSRMSTEHISDDEVMERLQKVFKNLDGIPVTVREFSTDNPPKEVSSRDQSPPSTYCLCYS